MFQQVYLVPAPGLTVLDPATYKPLPAEGAAKPLNNYWRRRIKDRDVTQGRPPVAVAPAQED
ncbi:MAG: DUF2635 domain-containing protein [Deltaproteobacteria bacterium]|nr:DUF2635 domain-containing protein [Deltaproteobacteria bacterium]